MMLRTRALLWGVLLVFTVSAATNGFFTRIPGNVTVLRGGVAEFPWSFDDTGVNSFQWLKLPQTLIGGLNLWQNEEGSPFIHVYERRAQRLDDYAYGFSLSDVSEADAGGYRITAYLISGTEFNIATLTVKYPPTETTASAPATTVNEGFRLQLSCTTRSNPPSTFQWTKDSTALNNPTAQENTVHDSTTSTSTVIIPRVSREDNGRYQCEASNGLSPDENAFIDIIVQYAPSNTVATVKEANITEGGRVELSCHAEGLPRPTYTWYKISDTYELPSDSSTDPTRGTLIIFPARLEDSGVYLCRASNGVGEPGSSRVNVTIIEALSPVPPPTMLTGTRNDNWFDSPLIVPIVVTVTTSCVLIIVGALIYHRRRKRSIKQRKCDRILSLSNNHHRERLEYLCPDMSVLRVSDATELDKMADPALQEFWDCLVRMDVDPVLMFLREKRSLTVDVTAGVRAAPCVVERLLEILCVLKGDQASRVLSDALRHSDQTHLADLLDGKVLPDAKCVTIATTTETSIGITFKPAYKNLQHFGDVDKYLVTLGLATPEPKVIARRHIHASDPLQAEFSGLEQGTSYNVTVISERGDVRSAGVTVTITTIGGYEEPSMLLQRFTGEERSKIHHVLIYKDTITLLEPLGNGNFGEVRHGVYKKGNKWMECAAKTLYDTAAPGEMVSLLQEGLRMIKFNHDNVLELTGICVHGNQAMIVLPYMKHGDLRKYLINKQTLPLLENLRLCLDIARGMAYLSDNDIVHRDLAARNCMLDENLRVKVADFGLCRDVHEKGYYRIQSWEVHVKLPYKWMAPESHATYIFDTKTDIWSYGIVLWEIFAAGQTPYPGMPGVSIVHHLKEGYRMDRPNRCPIMLYNSIMKQCWLTSPLERPNFKEVLRKIEQIHTSFKHRSDFENHDVQVHSLA
ncbi:uncharacterized protein LOC118424790 isoform X2 [Branchiostoma floridae]|uniref:receptor protein-tyrosine kinase n=1 Tax=Branchiostoma floridae TaxID=7739 RepID=A0A9J7LWI3_BRAFL|nr:uncharacterized protein LOC118424790 isoform X2 [Branchiostoma floridae]